MVKKKKVPIIRTKNSNKVNTVLRERGSSGHELFSRVKEKYKREGAEKKYELRNRGHV